MRLILLVAFLVGGCAMFGTPRPDSARMAADVAGLEGTFDVIEALQVSRFSMGSGCEYIEYARGDFLGDMSDGACAPPDGTEPMDDIARADHARVAQALAASGADSTSFGWVSFDPDGTVTLASFYLDDAPWYEFYQYLYDPKDDDPKESFEGELEYTRVNDAWWFEWSYF